MSGACSDPLLTLDFLTLMQVVDFQMFYWSDTIHHVKFDSLTFLHNLFYSQGHQCFPSFFSAVVI